MLDGTSNGQIIGCVALLLAAVMLRLSPSWFRRAFVIIVFGSGLLAATGGYATSLADAAVEALFG